MKKHIFPGRIARENGENTVDGSDESEPNSKPQSMFHLYRM